MNEKRTDVVESQTPQICSARLPGWRTAMNRVPFIKGLLHFWWALATMNPVAVFLIGPILTSCSGIRKIAR